MSEQTAISWCDHTFNPWWGCVKVSPACQHCYAETFSKRVGLKVWGPDSERRFFGPKHWNEPLKWDAKAKRDGVRRRVFCASMADVFEGGENDTVGCKMDEARAQLWDVIAETPHLDWLLLTKRPENIRLLYSPDFLLSPAKNVWLGATVENQEYFYKRIGHLLRAPAAVHFLSIEPMLGPIDLRMGGMSMPDFSAHDPLQPVDWVIAGGESGGHARPSHPDWFRSLRDQCQAAGVAFHFKQWGEWAPGENIERNHGTVETASWFNDHFDDEPDLYRVGKKAAGRLLDGREWNEFPTVRA